MAAITIRNLDDSIKRRLKIQAASNNRSMEEEGRRILGEALQDNSEAQGFGTLIHKRFLVVGGVELPPVQRKQRARKPVDFE